MAKVIVIYESKYGNTLRAAEKIAEGIKQSGGFEVSVSHIKKLNPKQLSEYDILLMGCPTHMGGPTRDTRNLLGKLGKLNLNGKTMAFFNCWSAAECEGKSVRILEEKLRQQAPGIRLISPGLSIKVPTMKGPFDDSELARCLEFGKNLAAQFKKQPAVSRT